MAILTAAGCAGAQTTAPARSSASNAVRAEIAPLGGEHVEAAAARPVEEAKPERPVTQADVAKPLVLNVVGKHVVVRPRPALASASHIEIESITIDDAFAVSPDSAGMLAGGLCAKQDRALCAPIDKDPIELVARHRGPMHLDLLIAAITGATCEASAYWLLRIDTRGAAVTRPIVGCFRLPHHPTRDPAPDAEAMGAGGEWPKETEGSAPWPPSIESGYSGFGDFSKYTIDLRSLRRLQLHRSAVVQ
jgi:hypothetical protein